MDKEEKKAGGDLIIQDFASGKSDAKRIYQILYIALAAVLTAVMFFYYTINEQIQELTKAVRQR